jgi:hypothetical protein
MPKRMQFGFTGNLDLISEDLWILIAKSGRFRNSVCNGVISGKIRGNLEHSTVKIAAKFGKIYFPIGPMTNFF